MAVNISGLRRNIKNVAHNYTDAQVKVREATSNDPWGPSSTMMSEIADLTYNVVAFSEIMQMVWKRLNDHGKNWRHVYKALVLLEYLIKTGSEKVAQQCKENIFAIQTLKDFQYLDDNKDQGINVREKAKALVALLKDDERLKNERIRALKAKERFAQSTAGIGNDTVYNHPRYEHSLQRAPGGGPPPNVSQAEYEAALAANPEMEAARPQTAGEEELQLQLALAMSREEAEQEESKSKSDDMRLQLALKKSQEEGTVPTQASAKASNDLLDLDFGNPAAAQQIPKLEAVGGELKQPPPPVRTDSAAVDPWGLPRQEQQQQQEHSASWGAAGAAAASNNAGAASEPDPWSPLPTQTQKPQMSSPIPGPGFPSDNDPWTAVKPAAAQEAPVLPSAATKAADGMDLFSPTAQSQLQEFDDLRSQIETDDGKKAGAAMGLSNNLTASPNPFDMNEMGETLNPSPSNGEMLRPSSASPNAIGGGAKPKKTVQSLLGEHSNLVNLDDLVSSTTTTAARNPFEQQQNPFQAKAQKPAMNDLRNQNWEQQQQEQQAEFNPFF